MNSFVQIKVLMLGYISVEMPLLQLKSRVNAPNYVIFSCGITFVRKFARNYAHLPVTFQSSSWTALLQNLFLSMSVNL
jgi:hypothetical protein